MSDENQSKVLRTVIETRKYFENGDVLKIEREENQLTGGRTVKTRRILDADWLLYLESREPMNKMPYGPGSRCKAAFDRLQNDQREAEKARAEQAELKRRIDEEVENLKRRCFIVDIEPFDVISEFTEIAEAAHLRTEKDYIKKMLNKTFSEFGTWLQIGDFSRFKTEEVLSVSYTTDEKNRIHCITVRHTHTEIDSTVEIPFGFLATQE